MFRTIVSFCILLTASTSLSAQTVNLLPDQSNATQQAAVTGNLSAMPLAFTKNMGQWPDSILFRASANGATMWFTKNGIWYQFFRTVNKTKASATAIDPSVDALDALPGKFSHERDSIETTMIKAEFVGASESVELVGLEELDYKCNYFIGNDHSKWRTDVSNYSAVTMRGLYPGVDVTFSAKDGRLLEKMNARSINDLVQVRVEYRGADNVTPQTDNIATVQASIGEHHFEGALLADRLASKQEQQVASATLSTSTLSLVYSTYLGGSGADRANAVTVGSDGSAYVAGFTSSADFPTANALDVGLSGARDAFVAKISTTGTSLVYCTYLGGSGKDGAFGVAVDSSGNAYVVGDTPSADFPVINAFDPTLNGYVNAFVAKLSPSGSTLVFSTYLGGGQYDIARAVAVDGTGDTYVIGQTESPDFPTVRAFDATHGGLEDAFITKLAPSGSSLIYSTFLGGGNADWAEGVAIDARGRACIAGSTSSTDFPTANPVAGTLSGYGDAFVTKITEAGDSLTFSTYLGGSSGESASAIAIDSAGAIYIAGMTNSSDFPTKSAVNANFSGGDADAFVAKLSSSGNSIDYSTYLGGTGLDIAYAIAVDEGGHAQIAGLTYSPNFPVSAGVIDATLDGTNDAFTTQLSSKGNRIVYSTYLGGEGEDYVYGIAVDTLGSAYLVSCPVNSFTKSADFFKD